jgi:S-DNA-T family DNA segregation ATPase FtsK/SpoIIIE
VDPCPECGFAYGVLPIGDVILGLQSNGDALVSRLAGADPSLAVRRTPDVWSPLEYCCHVRDMLLVQRDRLFVALVEDGPSFKPMYRDHRVSFDSYDSQDPGAVAAELAMATSMMVRAFSNLTPEQWRRPLIYNFPAPAPRTVAWMAHHTLHELVHHLSDIDRQADEA